MDDLGQKWKGSSLRDLFNGRDPWDYQQHINLTPSQEHCVLFQLPLPTQNKPPKPQRGEDKWDQDHVKLPTSHQSQYVEIDDLGGRKLKSRWNLIEETLLQPIPNVQELEIAIKSYNNRYENIWKFDSLQELFEVHYSVDDCSFFFDDLLPKIINIALRLPELIQKPIPLLKQGVNKSISMSQEQACCILANAFLCTFPRRNTEKKNSEFSNYPDINFNRLFGCKGQSVIEKLKCLVNYFRRSLCGEMSANVITFQRRCIKLHYKWENSEQICSNIKFHVSSIGKIEDAASMIQVDFANRFIGGGVLGNGCVQEEIRFVIAPELIVAKLFTECLSDDEALLMVGCEQFNSYSGYAASFKWADDFKDETPIDVNKRRKCRVVAIDALNYNTNAQQFRKAVIKRELHKAYVGFQGGIDKSPIASGLWGCGAFHGISLRSALIQFMACAVCHRNLAFFSNGDELIRDEVAEIFEILSEKKVTIGFLHGILESYFMDGNLLDPSVLGLFVKKRVLAFKSPVERSKMAVNVIRQQKLFEFMNSPKPSNSSSSSHQAPPTANKEKVESSAMKQKFESFDEIFGLRQSSETKKKEPAKSLIKSLDMDFDEV